MFNVTPDQIDRFNEDGFLVVERLADNVIDENFFPVLWRKDGYRTSGIADYLSR